MNLMKGELAKYVGRPTMVTITRIFPGESQHRGFVLGLSDKLVLIQQWHDFYAEGYAVLRVRDIEAVESGPKEDYNTRVVALEGMMAKTGIPYDVPLDGFKSVLQVAKKRNLVVIVECESRECGSDDWYHIGKVVGLNPASLSLLFFDAIGTWDWKPTVIPFTEMTKVQIDTPYANTMAKYLEKPLMVP
jgi:hypothetical protein